MSLPESVIDSWLKTHATDDSYPVHEVKEGAEWEFVKIKGGKELCLYPFTKNSIRYLYKYGLTQGHQTPRYIIRDIIEPVVTDILVDKNNFPSIKYNIVNVNTKNTDFFFMTQEDPEEAAKKIVELVHKKLPGYYRTPASQIQVLTPMQRGVVGATNLNMALQEALNPQGESLRRSGFVYRPNDKVMQIKNNFQICFHCKPSEDRE